VPKTIKVGRDSNQKKMLFYESIADSFDSVVNMYDTYKRLDVVYRELLTEDIKGKALLDAGCGTGWFSQAAAARGARVTSMDVGSELLKIVAQKCVSKRVIGDLMKMPFKAKSFDIVVSSEVIEHVTDPRKAISEMYRVLKPGGILIITTPNRFWYFSLLIANALKIRPYQGLENWQHWGDLKDLLTHKKFKLVRMRGIHLFPFVVPFTYPALDFFHWFGYSLGPVMVNIAIKAVKPL